MADPPDPGGGYVAPCPPCSPNLFSQMDLDPNSSTSRKRPQQEETAVPVKKTIINPSQSTPSIQSTYIHPDFSEKKTKYTDSDVAPFVVHVSKTVSDPSAGPTIRPLKFGHFLFRNNIKNVVTDGVKQIGRNRLSVEFKNEHAANTFIDHPALKHGQYEAIIPSYNVTRMGIVRGVPVEWTLEELVQAVEVPPGFGQAIKKMENITPTWTPTQTVVLTFNGQKLPPCVYCFFSSLPVEVYVLPTIQCNKCCRFGHISSQCRSSPRCFVCSQPHEGITCDKQASTCLFCSGPHPATDPHCPEHARQKSIKLVMSQESVSYLEASARFPQVRRSYSDTTKNMLPIITPSPSPPISIPSAPTSYRKTITSARQPYRPAASPGYDTHAHHFLTRTPQSITGNGCAIPNPESSSGNDNLIELLISTLINIFSKMNDVGLPNNLRNKLSELISIFNNVSSNPSVELSQYQ